MKKILLLLALTFGFSALAQNPTPFDNSIRVKSVQTAAGTPDFGVFDSNRILKQMSWSNVFAAFSTALPPGLPSQTGNNGKFLTTNGTAASWGVPTAEQTFTANGVVTKPLTFNNGAGTLSIYEDTGDFYLDATSGTNAIIFSANQIEIYGPSGYSEASSSGFTASYGSNGTAIYGDGLFVGDGLGNNMRVKSDRISFENAVDFSPKTQILATTPTADRVIILPDASGTLALNSSFTSYLPLTGGIITGDLQVPTLPATANSAISRNYLDNALTGLTWKNAVKVSTTTNHSLSGTANIDGVTVPAGTRVLVRFQTATEQNGIWVTAAGAWSRATDADSASEVQESTVMVGFGTVWKNTQWTQSNTITTLGTDPVNYAQVSGAGTYAPGAGLALAANVFSIATAGVTNAMLAGSISDSNISSASTWNAKQAALGFTPYNATNPSSYQTAAQVSTSLAGYVPTSRTINGLDLTANRTLTTTNIADSTNKRYQTDAQNTRNDATSSIQTQLDSKQLDRPTWDLTKGLYCFSHFMSNVLPADLATTSGGSGTSFTYGVFDANAKGTAKLNCGTSTFSWAGLVYGGFVTPNILLSNGNVNFKTKMMVDVLSDGTNAYYTQNGLMNSSGIPTNSLMVVYDTSGTLDGGGSVNFKCITTKAGVKSTTVTSIPIVAGQYYAIDIITDNSAGNVKYYIDSTLVATHTTNIPTAAMYCQSIIAKFSGTTARNLSLDYLQFTQLF